MEIFLVRDECDRIVDSFGDWAPVIGLRNVDLRHYIDGQVLDLEEGGAADLFAVELVAFGIHQSLEGDVPVAELCAV